MTRPPEDFVDSSQSAADPNSVKARNVGSGAAAAMEAGPGLSFGYRPGAAVLRDLHVKLRAGRLTVLLGPNASGKTTLLRLLLGQLTPDAGSVTLHGRPVATITARELARQVSYVPQRSGVSFAFSVREVVAMGRYAFGDRRYVEEALRHLDLANLATRPVRELSGGQQQRVMLARAWAQSRGAASDESQVVAGGKRAAAGGGAGGGDGGGWGGWCWRTSRRRTWTCGMRIGRCRCCGRWRARGWRCWWCCTTWRWPSAGRRRSGCCIARAADRRRHARAGPDAGHARAGLRRATRRGGPARTAELQRAAGALSGGSTR